MLIIHHFTEITSFDFVPRNRLYFNNFYPPQRFPHVDPNEKEPYYKEIDSYFKNDCKCIPIKECKSMIFLLTKFEYPLPGWFVKKLRGSSCGYSKNQPKVCCPYDKYGILKKQLEDNEEKDPWIWGESNSDENVNSRYNKDLDKLQNKIIDFEDEKTLKNCPPSIYDDHDWFDDDFDYHAFHHKKQVKNKHHPRFKSKSHIVTPSIEEPKKFSFESDDFCGVSVRTRLIGGTDVAPGQLPWMVRIGYINTSEYIWIFYYKKF